MEEHIGVGRRKRAVASVRLRPGTGKIDINKRPMEEYFPAERQRKLALTPLDAIEGHGKYDLVVRIKGGGIEAQVDAVKLGLARALVKEDDTRHQEFKVMGALTRDPRKKERKKYGRAGARKRFQFSKR